MSVTTFVSLSHQLTATAMTTAQIAAIEETEVDVAIERMYDQMLLDMRSAIELRGTIADFVKAQAEKGEKYNQANLYRVFVRNQGQEMGLSTYIRLARTLDLGGPLNARFKLMRTPKSNITVLDYLYIDNDAIMKSFTALQYYEAK